MPIRCGSDEDARAVADWLIATGHLESDDGMLFIGSEAERRYGRRHFMELLSVFTSHPEIVVLAGRVRSAIDPLVLLHEEPGPRFLALAGHAWRVTHIDWHGHRCWVERAEQAARMRWTSQGQPLSFALCRARRDALFGAVPPRLSKRAAAALDENGPDAPSRSDLMPQ